MRSSPDRRSGHRAGAQADRGGQGAGVDFDKIVLKELVDEGVKSFSDSYESLLDTIRDKASALVHAS